MDQIDMFEMFGIEHMKKIKSTEWKWKFSDYPKIKENALTCFSCFACGGGSTMGYKLAGVRVLGCVEIDKRMNDVYVKNHNPKYNYLMDIREFNEIPDDEIPAELFNLDILDGSPPCTTFSMNGLREETWGKLKKFREGQKEQTLDDLSFVFIETVNKLRPKTVIMENVEGLLLGDAWGYVQKIYQQMNEIGYKLAHFLIKGEQCGIPQRRHRVFFIGVRDDIGFDPAFLDMSFNYAPILYGDVKAGTGPEVNRNTKAFRVLSLATPADKAFDVVYERIGEKPRQFSHRIVWNSDIMNTIAAKNDIYRGEEKTRLSIEDVIHCQTFPEDYDFIERKLDNVFYICGMSVPPVMIKRIVQRLIDQGLYKYKLEDQNNEKDQRNDG